MKVLKRLYVASDLFSPWGRLRMERLGQCVRAVLTDAERQNLELFVPFKDSAQSLLSGDDKARAIFEIDIAMIQESALLVALCDGLVKDTGVCMEIGYARTNGTPCVIGVSDFLYESDSPENVTPTHPIFDVLGVPVIWMPHQDDSASEGAFEAIQMKHEDLFLRRVAAHAVSTMRAGGSIPLKRNKEPSLIFVDILGQKYEWARRMSLELCDQLSQISPLLTTGSIYQASRYSSADLAAGTRRDVVKLESAKVAVFCLDALETDSSSAVLMGIACALGIPFVLVRSSRRKYCNPDGQSMFVNLMIEQPATKIVSFRAVWPEVQRLWQSSL